MDTFLGGLKKAREVSGRYISKDIKAHIDSLNLVQIIKMKRALAAEMRRAYKSKNSYRFYELANEMEYINYRLEK